MQLTPQQSTARWLSKNLRWKLHEGQVLVYDKLQNLPTSTREACVLISRRWGKSYLGTCLALEKCLSKRNAQVWIVAPTIKQAKKIIQPLLQQITSDCPNGIIKQTKSEYLWKVGYSTLHLAGFDSVAESMRGMSADLILIEETGQARTENYEYIINSIFKPTLMHSRGRIIHLTTPGREVDHPLHLVTLPACDIAGSLFVYDIYSNPLLSKEDIDAEIESLGGINSPHVQRELFCRIIKDETLLVCPEFEVDVHTFDDYQVPPFANSLLVHDNGGVQDKHASIFCYFDFERHKLIVTAESFLDTQTPTDTLVTNYRELEGNNCNPKWKHSRLGDMPGQVKIDFAHKQFSIPQVSKPAGSWESSINETRTALKKNQILIHKSCVNLIATLKYGQYTANRKDFKRTEALSHLDLFDCLRYAWTRISKINPYPSNYGITINHGVSKRKQPTTNPLLKDLIDV